jgi:tRNA(Met) cytidine acetyltransferase
LPDDRIRIGGKRPAKMVNEARGGDRFRAVAPAHGFDVSAFAALSGTLRAGSLLVLLVPPLADWADKPGQKW